MQNMLRRRQVLNYSTNQTYIDLSGQREIKELRLRIAGTMTVAAGGVVDGVVNAMPILRLIRQIRIVHDDREIIMPMPLVPFGYLQRRMKLGNVAPTALAAGLQVATAFSHTVVISFSPEWLANPHDMFYIAREVKRQFRLYVDWETAVAAAGDDPGSGAIFTGGDRVVTFPTAPTLTVTEVSSVSNKLPVLYPKYTFASTDQFVAATGALPFRLLNKERIAAQLIMEREGALNPPAPAAAGNIAAITLRAGSVRKLDDVAANDLHEEDIERFPAINGSVAPNLDGGVGTIFLLHADHGKLLNSLDPAKLGTDPRYEFNVPIPTTAPGVVQILSLELFGEPGETQLPA